MENCPNCNEKLKTGFRKTVTLLDDKEVLLINEYTGENKEYYCTSCGDKSLEDSKRQLINEIAELNKSMEDNVGLVPLLSTHTPYGWEYSSLGIVTGQTVTGTGVISEFKSSFTDFFGGQSGSFNKKLAEGEKMAFAQLRTKTIEMGGNAVIAVDIDYADVGSGKGMLMVCATGTAIRVKNDNVFSSETQSKLSDLVKNNERLKYLNNSFHKFTY